MSRIDKNKGGEFVEDFWKNLAALVKVKTVVTFVIVGVFAALALTGKFQPDSVMTVVTMVVAFYFGTQAEKRSAGEAEAVAGSGTDQAGGKAA